VELEFPMHQRVNAAGAAEGGRGVRCRCWLHRPDFRWTSQATHAAFTVESTDLSRRTCRRISTQ